MIKQRKWSTKKCTTRKLQLQKKDEIRPSRVLHSGLGMSSITGTI
ncbi:hypothetical protein DAI22_05g218456 [Oryza sativa Japonica Group]|nr:hypothetical protein DAI22_05g218456 [Oryza sativa Japonica Group]